MIKNLMQLLMLKINKYYSISLSNADFLILSKTKRKVLFMLLYYYFILMVFLRKSILKKLKKRYEEEIWIKDILLILRIKWLFPMKKNKDMEHKWLLMTTEI